MADDVTSERYTTILAQQRSAWPKHLAGAKDGNPFATLCQHCCGRHIPPRDDICPNNAPPRIRGGSNGGP